MLTSTYLAKNIATLSIQKKILSASKSDKSL
jgi:hypothetical protein